MQVTSTSFKDKGVIPGEFAFAVTDQKTHIALSSNKNPELSWSGAPSETKSFAIICHDPHVPSQGDQVNKEGQTVPASLARVNFHHWVLVNIPAATTHIPAGSHSSSVTPKGKTASQSPVGLAGINDYTAWFKGDQDMGGNYFGYDGPCPPWNDEIKHEYVFMVYALSVEQLPLSGPFTGADALKAMSGYVLAKSCVVGVYSLNPAVQL
jgi:Raf kinase inhibitor-like YbhB/YbcL family protein